MLYIFCRNCRGSLLIALPWGSAIVRSKAHGKVVYGEPFGCMLVFVDDLTFHSCLGEIGWESCFRRCGAIVFTALKFMCCGSWTIPNNVWWGTVFSVSKWNWKSSEVYTTRLKLHPFCLSSLVPLLDATDSDLGSWLYLVESWYLDFWGRFKCSAILCIETFE